VQLLHDGVTLAQRAAGGATIAAALALTARRAGALTWSGVAAALVVGSISFAFGGLVVAAAIVIFFVSGSLLGRIQPRDRRDRNDLGTKGAQRDAAQVLANGGIATVCAVVGGFAALRSWPHAIAWIMASVCAVAAASGDTWSTEIGKLSRAVPRRITDGRTVEAGTSGGVTWLGTLAAPVGGRQSGLVCGGG
jgi:uncharacterized protein (TIGR00297 family)